MSNIAIPLSDLATTGRWQSDFTAIIPAIETHAQIRFRRLPPEHREEAVAESIAAACQQYGRLAAQGKLGQAFVGSLADFAVRHAIQGRHLGGHQDSARDVMSPICQHRHDVRVQRLNMRPSGAGCEGWRKLVLADRQADVPALAAFRIDFADWLRTRSRRDQRVIGHLAAGDRTMDIADQFGLTEGRVSQLRRKYQRAWLSFQGEAVADRAA